MRRVCECVGVCGFVVTALLMATPVAVRAQVAAAEITGAVGDQAGAPVRGATVTVTNIATNQVRVAVTTGDGIFTVASLAPGDYRLEIVLAGFRTIRREGV